MRGQIFRRPSPAMVVACLALFLTLGGVGYAAATINGSSIKNGTITPGKIKSRSLSGTQFRASGIGGPSIKESTLSEVPKAKLAATATSATKATSATTAANAEQLGGVAASTYQRYGTSLPAGQTVSGAFGCYQEDDTAVTGCTSVASFPVPATGSLADNTVNFAASSGSFNATDADPTCTGNVNAPTAPPGKVCLYVSNFVTDPAAKAVSGQANILTGTSGASARGFEVDLTSVAAATLSVNIEGVWAYTAP